MTESVFDFTNESVYDIVSNSSNFSLKCQNQLFIPVWEPQNVGQGDIVFRGTVYLAVMAYIFLGLSYAADKFMASIEFITSKKKEVQVRDENGKPKTIVVRIWNETVANMTLMAMGCSAPEILLGIIEVIGKGFEADELGPSVAVGSAAINVFVVVGVVNLLLPLNETRRIKRISVFLVNAIWSLFSFCWLFIILKCSSPGVVDIWEGVVTFLFFPLTVITAYLTDKRKATYSSLSKTYGMGHNGIIVETTTDDVKLVKTDFSFKHLNETANDGVADLEEHRQALIRAMKSIRRRHPVATPRQLELMAEKELLQQRAVNRTVYQPISFLVFGSSRRPSFQGPKFDLQSSAGSSRRGNMTKVRFRTSHFTVMKETEELRVAVVREDGNLNNQLLVDYITEDGEALAHQDFVPLYGTLMFEPGETRKVISVRIKNSGVYRGDRCFCIRLFNIRTMAYPQVPRTAEAKLIEDLQNALQDMEENNFLFPPKVSQSRRNSLVSSQGEETETYIPGNSRIPSITVIDADLPKVHPAAHQEACLGSPSLATVMILDNCHQGIFNVAESKVTITETVGAYDVQILRCAGSKGRVAVPYYTEEGTAKQPRDYEHCEGEIVFEDGETEKTVPLTIQFNSSYQKDKFFYFFLKNPRNLSDEHEDHTIQSISYKCANKDLGTGTGSAQLGDVTSTLIRLRENKAFKSSVDKMMKKTNVTWRNGYSAWIQQFTALLQVDTREEPRSKRPPILTYLLYILNIPWRLALAFVPPESLMSGYPCFLGSVLFLGILSSLLGDFATLFGCTVGLDDSVTAVALVAFGTTVPDLLVSRSAALRDKHADASINNVFTSKSLNVYFGIGIAWSSAAIYHELRGEKFFVDPGDLAFGLSLYVGLAVLCIGILLLKRIPAGQGELGGSLKYRLPMSLVFLISWIVYVTLHTLQVYGVIEAF